MRHVTRWAMAAAAVFFASLVMFASAPKLLRIQPLPAAARGAPAAAAAKNAGAAPAAAAAASAKPVTGTAPSRPEPTVAERLRSMPDMPPNLRVEEFIHRKKRFWKVRPRRGDAAELTQQVSKAEREVLKKEFKEA